MTEDEDQPFHLPALPDFLTMKPDEATKREDGFRFEGWFSPEGEPMSLVEWGNLINDHTDEAKLRKIIGADSIIVTADGEPLYEITVSTVWIGLDHGYCEDKPCIFETLIIQRFLQGDDEPIKTRYHNSYDDVREFHSTVVNNLRQLLSEGSDLRDFIASADGDAEPRTDGSTREGVDAGGTDNAGADQAARQRVGRSDHRLRAEVGQSDPQASDGGGNAGDAPRGAERQLPDSSDDDVQRTDDPEV